MPDLVGLPETEASRRLGELEDVNRLGISSNWGRPVPVHCQVRPGTVARQAPEAGTALGRRAVLHIRTAELDLMQFRGPCEPADGDLGPVQGSDAKLARQFYRFSAKPSLGAPFVSGDVWNGIEAGPTATLLDANQRVQLTAWDLDTRYAERSGPFSALDVVAGSGGYFELHRGVVPTCATQSDNSPAGLASLRAITLTAPKDTISACMQWWGVTLFLDGNLIAGVALRLGSP
jgi:hypothetical protein